MTAAELLDTAVALLADGQPDAERLRGLAEWLSTGAREVDGIDGGKPPAVLLAGGRQSRPRSRWFPGGVPTAVRRHRSRGVATVEGRDRYERWEHHRVAEASELGRGDAVWWRDPPHNVHRQEGLGRGAVELVLVGRFTQRGELTAVQRAAPVVQSGDVAGLTELYRDDSLLDVNVATRRTSCRGRRPSAERSRRTCRLLDGSPAGAPK